VKHDFQCGGGSFSMRDKSWDKWGRRVCKKWYTYDHTLGVAWSHTYVCRWSLEIIWTI